MSPLSAGSVRTFGTLTGPVDPAVAVDEPGPVMATLVTLSRGQASCGCRASPRTAARRTSQGVRVVAHCSVHGWAGLPLGAAAAVEVAARVEELHDLGPLRGRHHEEVLERWRALHGQVRFEEMSGLAHSVGPLKAPLVGAGGE